MNKKYDIIFSAVGIRYSTFQQTGAYSLTPSLQPGPAHHFLLLFLENKKVPRVGIKLGFDQGTSQYPLRRHNHSATTP